MEKQLESGQHQLAALLRQVYQEGLSGHIFYIVTGGSNGKIEVNQGDLYGFTYRGQPISVSDFATLNLNKSVLVQRAPDDSLAPAPGVPQITALIQALETPVTEPKTIPEPPLPQENQPQDIIQPTVDLTAAAIQILTGLYGSERAFKQVNKVAGQCPPDQNPQQFLEKCTELAALTLGPGAAHEMFYPLYEKVLAR